VVEVGVGRVSRLANPEVRRGALGVALDISQVGLRRAAAAAGPDVAFVRADAQRLPFRSGGVDLIVGTSIVHHLDVAATAAEMARSLSADGRVLLLEPRVGSPLLRVFRRFTPGLRSADEHPLSPCDIATLREWFTASKVEDFALTSLAVAPLLRKGDGDALAAALGRLDRVVLRLAPVLGRWAWIAVIELTRPRSGTGHESLE
jgi:SAM-dependent methyltransferase